MTNTLIKVSILLFLLVRVSTLTAQQIQTVKGIVQGVESKDKEKEPLPFASLTVLNAKDSTLVKGTSSDKTGNFSIQYPVRKGKRYLLKVSYLGFESSYRVLPDTATVIRLGTVLLANTGMVMNEVVVTGKLPEISMKGDTAVIHADAFKTPEGSSVKDLVKRVPGLEYDEDNHTLTFNGKPIKEINVNGETFFLDNIQVAIESLPAKFISKLKVYDKKTEKEKATGIKEGTENYVLDLQTKKELNNTILADATVGAGNHQKKDLDGKLNYFKKGGDNISIIGRSTNRYMNSTYKDNIQNSAGLNFMHHFGKKLSLNASAMYDMGRSGNISTNYSEQYLKSGNQYSSSASEGNQSNKRVNSNIGLRWELNKRINLYLSGGFNINQNEGLNASESASFSASPGLELTNPFATFDEVPDSIKVNRNKSNSISKNRSSSSNFSGNFTYKLNEKGTNLNINIYNNNSNRKGESNSETSIKYFRLKDKEGNDSLQYRNQYRYSPSDNNSWGTGLAFTHPVTKSLRLQLSYNLSSNQESDNNDTYDISTGTKLFVDSLSNRSSGKTLENRVGFLLNYSDTIWNVNAMISAAPQQRSIDRKVGLQEKDSTIHSTNLQSNFNVNWKRKDYRLTFSYNVYTSQPSLSSLVTLTDNSDPLYITHGNPNLKPSVGHGLRLNLDNFKKGLAGYIGFNATQNKETQVTSYNEQTGGRVTWPININGDWNVNGSLRGLKKWGKLSVSLEGSGGYRNNVGMINEDLKSDPERSTTRSTSLRGQLRTSYQPIWGGFSLTTNYNFDHSLNTLRNTNNYTRNCNFRFDGHVDIPGGVQLRSDVGYLLRSGTNLQKSDANEVNWNAGAIWRFLKDKKAELGVYWSDILGQAKSYGRMATSDGFYEYHSQQTRGYIMGTFKYNLRIMR